MEGTDLTLEMEAPVFLLTPQSSSAWWAHPFVKPVALPEPWKSSGLEQECKEWGCLAPESWQGRAGAPGTHPNLATATGEQNLCRAAPYNHWLSTFLLTLPVPAVAYGSKEITLLSKARKEKQVLLCAKIFVFTCFKDLHSTEQMCFSFSALLYEATYTCIQVAEKSPIIELHQVFFFFFFFLTNSILASKQDFCLYWVWHTTVSLKIKALGFTYQVPTKGFLK